MTDKTQALLPVTPERDLAQFFFEMGFGACYAEAIVRNGNKVPFPLTDAEIERQWAISREAYDDADELEAMLSLARGQSHSLPGDALVGLEWSEDGYSLRTPYDGDVDGDGRHIVVGGETVVTFADSEAGDGYRARFLAALTPSATISDATKRMEQTLGATFQPTPSALSGDAGENYRDCVEAALAPARQWWGGGKHGDDHIYLISNMMADLRIFHAPKASAQGWQPIETCPDEDLFIGAVHVTDNRTGAKWWDRHLLALDDETGAIHADYDHGWELANYEWWHPLTLPPIPAALPSHQGAE